MFEPPLLPLLDAPDAETAAAGQGLPEAFASVNLFRATMHHGPIARIVGDVVSALVIGSVLDARTREVAILRVGWRIGSVYEWSNHVPIARRAGMTDDEIVAIRTADAERLTPLDLVAIRVVDEALDNVAVAEQTIIEARTLVGDDNALLELLMIPGCYRTIGTVLLSLGVPLEDHVEAWPPDGEVAG